MIGFGNLPSGPAFRRPDFNGWMAKVAAAIARRTGLDYRDLPDFAYADWHAAGETPGRAAAAAIRNAKDF